MIQSRAVLVTLIAIGLGASAQAQEAAPPLAPRQLELRTPSVPVQMLAPDARRLVARLGSAAAPAAPPPRRPSGGTARTIRLPHPPLANESRQFVFRDATDRTELVKVEVPLAQRRAAVEAFRQSLVKRKGAHR